MTSKYTWETDDQGRLLMNIASAASEVLEHYTRYNSGWIKRVTGLDKSVTDGYSIIGDFADKGLTWHEPGLYLDCSIGGSRKNQDRWFHLFILKPDGEIEQVGKPLNMDGRSGGDWAPRLWHEIERQLTRLRDEKPDPNKLFPVLEISRDMLAERYGAKAYDLTDAQMIQIADHISNDFSLLTEAFDTAIETTLEYFEIKLEDDDDT